jgi:biotin transporter BioY
MSDQSLKGSVVQRIVVRLATTVAVIFLIGCTVFGAILSAARTQALTSHVSDAPDVIISAIIGGLIAFCIGSLVPAVILTLSAIEKNTRNIAVMLERTQNRASS